MNDLGQAESAVVFARIDIVKRRLATLVLVASVSASCVGWGAAAFAQGQGASSVGSPIPSGSGTLTPKPDTPPQRADELGIPIGSFRLFPTLDVRGGYDTNVFARPAGQQTGSGYEVVRPSLSLQSDWTSHMLNIDVFGLFGFYNSASSQNYQNFGISADSRIEIQRDWFVAPTASFTRTTEALGSPDTALATAPTAVYTLPLGLSMYQRFNRLFYQATATATGFRYQNYGVTPFTTLPDQNRNRNEFTESLRGGYEIYDGFDVWLQAGLNQRSYLQGVTNSGVNLAAFNQQRDSTGWQASAGATIDLGGISKLEGFVGYTQQNYSGVSTPALSFGLGGVWNGYQPLVVRPFVLRSVNETAFSQYQNYVSTTVGSQFVYTIQEGWVLDAGVSLALLDYTPLPGTIGTTQHTDTFWRASLGLQYSIRPQISIGPLYEFSSGSGGDPVASPNYTRHIFMLRLIAKR